MHVTMCTVTAFLTINIFLEFPMLYVYSYTHHNIRLCASNGYNYTHSIDTVTLTKWIQLHSPIGYNYNDEMDTVTLTTKRIKLHNYT